MVFMSSLPTFDEEDRFSREYGYLVCLLTKFLDIENEVKPLQEVLDKWLLTQDKIYFGSRAEIVREGRAFMKQNELPWTVIVSMMNRHFDSKEALYAWLSDALDQIEATLRA